MAATTTMTINMTIISMTIITMAIIDRRVLRPARSRPGARARVLGIDCVEYPDRAAALRPDN
jgi:hypothetical protein